MRSCDRCGKGVQVGMNVSHSHVRTKKRSYPNLHVFRVKEGGVVRRLRICTKCLRIVKAQVADKAVGLKPDLVEAPAIAEAQEINVVTESAQERETSKKSKPTPDKDLESVKEELTKAI